MSIQTRCPACNKSYRVRDEFAGKPLKCTGCDKRFTVRADAEDEPIIRTGKTKRKSGGGVMLLLGLGVVGLLAVCCGGVGVGGYYLYSWPDQKNTVVVNGQTGTVDPTEFDKRMEAAFKDAKKRNKDLGKELMKDLGKELTKDLGKELTKDIGKELTKDIGKEIEKALKLEPGKTIPEFTVQPELLPLSSRPGAIYAPRGRKGLVVMRFGEGEGPGPPRKEGAPEPRLERINVADGKSLGGAGLKAVGLDVRDLSPDGSLAALGRFGGGYAFVSLIDGKALTMDWRPTVERKLPGYSRPVNDRGFRFLAPNRWLVIYEDDAVEIFSTDNGTAWQRHILQGPQPQQDPRVFRASLVGWGISNDGKTLAYWTGAGFDLIDTTTGAVRKTPALALEGNETNLNPLQVQFSPDDSQLLANMGATTTKKVGKRTALSATYYLTRWDVKGDSPPARLPIKGALRGYSWWGNQHILRNGSRKSGISGVVYDAATGKALAELKHKGQPLRDCDPDGKLRFLTREFTDTDEGQLFQADFPTRLLDELRRRGSTGTLPVLQASKDGLGILP